MDSPLELIWVYLHVNTQADIIFGCFYCPPHSPVSDLDHLHVSLSAVKSKYPAAKIFLGGDFNCPGIDWSNNSLIHSYIPLSFREYLITFAADFYLNQIVTSPTRGSNVLDLCFVTHPDVVHLCQVIPGLSDHDAVLVKFSHRVHINKKQPRKVPLYKNANWDAIRQDFSVMSEEYLQLNSVSHMSVEEIWHYFHDHVMNSVNKHVPSKVLSTRFHLPWLTVTVKRLIRKKQRVYNRARRYQRECDWKEYKILRYKIRNQLRDLHKNHLTKVISSENNKKPLWHYIKSKRQDHTGVSTLRVNGTVISDSVSKVEALNQHFMSVFTIEETDNLSDKGISPYPATSNIEITVPGIYNLLSNCNPHKSPGPDNVHNYVLRETAADIAPLLTHLFQQSLTTGTCQMIGREHYSYSYLQERKEKRSKKLSACFSYFCSLQNHGTCYCQPYHETP